MKRRSFLQKGALAGAAALAADLHVPGQSDIPASTAVPNATAVPKATAVPNAPAVPDAPSREFYLLRRYRLARAQSAGCDTFLETAMLPALHRLGFTDVGVFGLEYGPETPTTYLLLKHVDAARLLQLDEDLVQDAEFMTGATAFHGAPAALPAFERIDDTLLHAFQGRPILQLPAKGKRLFQLRIYQSPSQAAHLRKVEMFHSGEFEIFAQCGMAAVFYADTRTGESLPSLTYMLRFDSLADLEARWEQFRINPAWKKLSASPRFAYEDLVSKITNLLLSPKRFSEI